MPLLIQFIATHIGYTSWS